MATAFSKDLNCEVVLGEYVEVNRVDGSGKTDHSEEVSAKFAKLEKKIQKPRLMGSIARHMAGVIGQQGPESVEIFEIVKIDLFNCILYIKSCSDGTIYAIDGDDRYGRYVIVNEAKVAQLQYRKETLEAELASINAILEQV